jgi:formylglycine-generating enzyme required for sulfatase activity
VKSKIPDWTEYRVYHALVQAWLDREQIKLRKQGRPDITAAMLYRACLLVAGQMRRNQSRFLTEAQLDQWMKSHSELKPITEIEFGGRSLLNRNGRGDYRFSHFSIQEFLEAMQVMAAGANGDRIEVPPMASENVIRIVLDDRAKDCPAKPVVLRELNLAKFDLKGLDLRGCDFSGSDLSGADLSGANLAAAQLDRAVLRNTRLAEADLTGVNLTQPVARWPFTQAVSQTVTIEFVWIPPGVFRMGETGTEQVQVTLTRGFWMSKYPVTQRQYEALTGTNPSHFKKSGMDAPVECVSWNEAVAYCAKLGRHQQEIGGGPPVAYRLPTEAEWEYACRAGGSGDFFFGNEAYKVSEYAWYSYNSDKTTHPVGEKKPNAWELHDMHGNVWEWCQDWHGPYPKGPVNDPVGQTTGIARVVRGGSFFVDSSKLRCGHRGFNVPIARGSGVGFRVVCAGESAVA